MPVIKPSFTTPMTADKLLLTALQVAAPGDKVFFGFGNYADEAAATTALTGTAALAALETTATKTFEALGELTEKGFSLDSKREVLKTRNTAQPGKRTTTAEITISGLGFSQVTYLDSANFTGKQVTLVIASFDLKNLVVLNGATFTVDVKGETDGLWTVGIKTEFSGALDGKLFVFQNGASTRDGTRSGEEE